METKIMTGNGKTAIIEKNGIRYLAVSTGLKSKSFKGTKTAELISKPGIITSEGKTEDWTVEGFDEINGVMYYYGPCIEGTMLSDISPDLKILSELLKGFKALNKTGYKTKRFSLSSVIRTGDGKLLFLPPLLTDFLNHRRTEDENLETVYPWNHPELAGEEAQAFTTACLAYQLICGKPAFSGRHCEEIEAAIKQADYASPLLYAPGLHPEISRLITESFEGRAVIADWQKRLSSLNREDWDDNSLSDNERALILKTAEKKEGRRLKRNKLRKTIVKNRSKLIISAAAAALLILIFVTSLSEALKPPMTLGMSRTEVIRLYYESYNSLDFTGMEDCITSKAGKGDIDSVVSVTAVLKTRSAYEGNSGMLSAEEWTKTGRPLIEPGVFLWGLHNITIEEISPELFAVDYEKWTPPEPDDSASYEAPSAGWPEGYLVRDIVHLSKKKEYWIIDRLDRNITGKIENMENTPND